LEGFIEDVIVNRENANREDVVGDWIEDVGVDMENTNGEDMVGGLDRRCSS